MLKCVDERGKKEALQPSGLVAHLGLNLNCLRSHWEQVGEDTGSLLCTVLLAM